MFVLNSQPLPEGTLFVTHKPGRNLEADSESVITDPKNEVDRDKILCLHGVGDGGGETVPLSSQRFVGLHLDVHFKLCVITFEKKNKYTIK